METKGDIREAPALGGFGVTTEALAKLQADYLAGAMEVWNRVLQPGAAPKRPPDRRFAASEWSASPGSAYLAEMYLLNARTLLGMVESLQADEKTRSRVRFAVLQWIDAASPSNFLALNPEAQKKAIETQGESLADGMRHLWNDLQQGHLSQTDETAFEVGRNVATTEGWVVFENEFFQLTTKTRLPSLTAWRMSEFSGCRSRM